MDHGGEALIGLVGAHGDAFELLELDRSSTRVGTDMGLQIGEYVVKNVMQPVVTSSR
jgi:hypothetical protein